MVAEAALHQHEILTDALAGSANIGIPFHSTVRRQIHPSAELKSDGVLRPCQGLSYVQYKILHNFNINRLYPWFGGLSTIPFGSDDPRLLGIPFEGLGGIGHGQIKDPVRHLRHVGPAFQIVDSPILDFLKRLKDGWHIQACQSQ